MNHRTLGRTGWPVSEIGHGLWGMAGWTGSSDRESLAALQASVDEGCTFFDSAWAYGEGQSDGLLGELLRRNPARRLYVASKVPPMSRRWPATPADAYGDAYPRDHVIEHAALIRERLGVDCIDLLQLHTWDDSWTGSDWAATAAELKARGWIRAFGLSLNRWQPANGLRALRTGHVDCVQVIYNVFDQAPEDELFPACRELGVGVIARVPLDEGSLAGKMTLATRFPAGDWRARYFGPENLPPTIARVERLRELVPAGMSLAELALRFVLACPDVSTTIVGMRRLEHVRANLRASDGVPLAPDLVEALRAHRWDRAPAPWSD